jgi:hypothetical protein
MGRYTVNGEVATHPKTDAGIKSACANPVGSTTRGKPKYTSEEQSEVESEASTDYI